LNMKTLSKIFIIMLFGCIAVFSAIVKNGNVLEITVQDHPEFSGRFTVSENGTIDYPLLSDEVIVNISTAELMNQLTFRLAKHIDNPLVLVAVVEKPEITVTVLGEALRPGPVKTYLGATLQEVLVLVGGPSPSADLTKIKILPKNTPDINARFFDLEKFKASGSMDSMPRLLADDVIVLLTKERSDKIKVIGGVAKPGFFDVTEKMNVFEAIYLAGGPAEKADLSRVRRISQSNGKTTEEIINIQQFIDKGKMDGIPMVNPGDVIIVYTRWFDWQMMMTVLSNTLLFIVTLKAFGALF
jgi:protein involved in polysaccharide export with SLBB domain